MSPDPALNEVMESVIPNENYPASQESRSKATDEDNLMKLFDQFPAQCCPC